MGIPVGIKQVTSDLSMLPEKTAGATSVMDKTLKLTNSIIDNAIYFNIIRGSFAGGAIILKGRFKDFTDLLSLPNVLTQVKDILKGSFWVADRVKNAGKALLTLGQAFDFVRLLDAFKLVSLKSITSAIGRVPFVGSSIPLFLPIAVIKDSFFLGSTLTNVWQTTQDISAVSRRQAECQRKAIYWRDIQETAKQQDVSVRLHNECVEKVIKNGKRIDRERSQGSQETEAGFTKRKGFWQSILNEEKRKPSKEARENHLKSQFLAISHYKAEKWKLRLANNQKLQTQRWLALAADVSKTAVIALGLSMGVFGVNPSTVVPAGFTFGSVFNPVALVANAMGLYKAMHDANVSLEKGIRNPIIDRDVKSI